MKSGIYCIPNAPNQKGDLWVRVQASKVYPMPPCGVWWLNKTFSASEFLNVLKGTTK